MKRRWPLNVLSGCTGVAAVSATLVQRLCLDRVEAAYVGMGGDPAEFFSDQEALQALLLTECNMALALRLRLLDTNLGLAQPRRVGARYPLPGWIARSSL